MYSKYEEIYAPAVDEFVRITDNTYEREEVYASMTNYHFVASLRHTHSTNRF